MRHISSISFSVAALLAAGNAVAAGDSTQDLDQRLRVLERQVEIQKEEAAAAALKNPIVKTGEKGLSFSTPDGAFAFNIKALVQGDNRIFLDDDNLTAGARSNNSDGFLLRRIRPSFEGQLGSLVAFRLTPDFAPVGSTTVSSQIVDAYVDLKFSPAATVRLGKQKGPVGLERLQSGGAITFAERAFPTELAPNRDLGAQLQGDLFAGAASYALGIYNGTPDGRDAAASDPDELYHYGGRAFFQPWINQADSPLSGLGFGLGASGGKTRGGGNDLLPRYRSPGQLTIFSYQGATAAVPAAGAQPAVAAAAAVEAAGTHYRYSPQGYFYRGPLGLLGEYIVSEQRLGRGNSRARLKHDAWALTGSWVVTGEDAGFKGVAKPRQPFAPTQGGWGAVELAARVSSVDFDDGSFKTLAGRPLADSFADPRSSVTEATAYGLGVNWSLTGNTKLVFDYQQTRFKGGEASALTAAGTPAATSTAVDRDDEKLFITRIQYSF